MSETRAYRADDIPAAPSVARARAIWQRAAHDVTVEIADGARLAELREAWAALLTRADAGNVFMDPALICAAADVAPQTQHRTVLVWKSIAGKRLLVGSWSFAAGR